MRKVFIADAHLRMENDANYRLLLQFLETLPGNTDTLFILGDLFEFWVGYPRLPFPHYRAMLEQLRRVHEAGIKIIYFEGNHDFHMGPFFEETLNATILRGSGVFEVDGKRLYLCHGDQINRADLGHLMLRFILHNRVTGAVIPLVPPVIVSWIADRMGRASRKNHDGRRIKWDYPAILEEFAAARFLEGCDAVIVGHFHLPLMEEKKNGGTRTILSLGDWVSHFTYGELRDGVFSLKEYRP